MSELKPRITENGIDYILVGDYYIPDLKLPEEHRPIGKYGRMHREYLREVHPARLNTLILTGELWTYLADLNEQAQERISEVSRIIKRLYEDNVNGKISDERFMELSADYEQEQRELKERTAALQAELDKSQAATVNAEKFMGIVRKHLAFEELTPTLLREMVEKIVVHECSYDENKHRRQEIEIYYSFVGKVDLPDE